MFSFTPWPLYTQGEKTPLPIEYEAECVFETVWTFRKKEEPRIRAGS